VQIVGRRRDAQVKIGGHRVELAEVEKCAETVGSVRKAAMVVSASQRLVGFVQVVSGVQEEEARREVSEWVAARLPDYMVPKAWVVLDSMPLSRNGKLDRNRLAELVAELEEGSPAVDEGPEHDQLEQIILEIARELLNDTGKRLRSTTSLIEFGMTSLMAIRFSKKLSERIKRKFPHTLVFNYSTVTKIAAMITSQSDGPVLAAEPTSYRANRAAVAVIGMACRFPGGVASPDEFWTMLQSGRDCVTDAPRCRLDLDPLYDPKPNTINKTYTKKGAFIDDADLFDNELFNIPLAEARAMDPQQRLFLEVADEALRSAGLDTETLSGSSTGVFVGQMNYDWLAVNAQPQAYAGTGMSPSITANRVSFALGLHGPSLSVDTACSSSLVAVELAVEKLRANRCSLAVVGGVNLMLSEEPYLVTCAARMLSVDGRCATFDSQANGIVRGEGAGCVVLKLLDQALADGDKVLAVVRGAAVNQDGRSATLTAPNGLAQQALIRTALRDASLEGKDIDYVECHGTGTKLGDPIEVEALGRVLGNDRSKPVVLGAVKTNIGHLEGAAGIAGFIKTVLVLQHRQAPPNLHFKTLNPAMSLDSFQGVVPVVKTTIAVDGEIRAGVSSFGFGGTNCHVVLESYGQGERSARSVGTLKSSNRRRIGWEKRRKGHAATGMYEVKWVPVSQGARSAPLSANCVAKWRCLLCTFTPVQVDNTRWVNAVHNPKGSGLTLAGMEQKRRAVDLQEAASLETLLKNEDWSSVVFVASGGEANLTLRCGIALFKALHKVFVARKLKPPQVWITTDSAEDEAGLWALSRTARAEIPELHVRCVALHQFSNAAEIAQLFCRIKSEVSEAEVELWLTADRTYCRRLVQRQLSGESSCGRRSIVGEKTYVVSGGLGGLGLVLAEWLVASGATHVALLSRSAGVQQREVVERVRNLKEGVRVEWVACDVSRAEEMQGVADLLGREWPQVAGVFHAAGELFDTTIANIEATWVAEALAAKVNGARNLHAVFSACEFMVMFSSLSGVFGWVGQGLYAAANAAMDALAERWSVGGQMSVVSIQWGAWSQVGMAARVEGLVKRLGDLGFGAISNSDGMRALEGLLEARVRGVVCVADLDVGKMNQSAFLSGLRQDETNLDNRSVLVKVKLHEYY